MKHKQGSDRDLVHAMSSINKLRKKEREARTRGIMHSTEERARRAQEIARKREKLVAQIMRW